jgi:predicted MFS family arabinose efflux permease
MESSGGIPDRRLALILPSAFATSLGIGILNLGMLFLIKSSFGADPETIGWFTALWCAAYFAGCVALRRLARFMSATASMTLACASIAALMALHLALPSLASAFACYGLYGFACALFWPRAMGWLASGLEGTGITRAYGAYNIAWSVACIISPYAAGALTEISPRLPVLVGIAIFAANAVFVALASRKVRPPVLAPLDPKERKKSASEDRSTPLRFPTWFGLFAVYVLYSVFTNIFPVFAKDELALSESSIGLFLLARAAASAIGFWALGRMSSWQFKPLLIPAALLAALALDISFAAASGKAWLLIGVVISGFIMSWAYSMSIFYGASGAPDRDKRMSIHEAVLTAGQVVGSVAGGAVYQRSSWTSIFLLTALLIAACLAAQAFSLRRR